MKTDKLFYCSMRLIVAPKHRVPTVARNILVAAEQRVPGLSQVEAVDLLETVLVYKLVYGPMRLILDIPDPLLGRLAPTGGDLSRAVLEGFAADAYRAGRLSRAEVGHLPGHQSVWETEELLSRHDAWPSPNLDEVLSDLAHLRAADMP